MDSTSQLRIRWNNFPVTVSSSLEALRSNGDLVDTSLFCEGHRFLAHRVVLSATSNYFRQIFKEISSPNVAIVLSGLNHQDIEAILTFIYSGEVSLCEPQLASFLKTAETLQVKGLGPECTSSFSRKPESNKADTVQETQFLAAALQKPLSSKRATPPPLLSVYPTASSVTPVTTTASLPSIDLGLALSNLTSSGASSSSNSSLSDTSFKRRKITELTDGCLKSENSEEIRKPEHMVMVDMTPPNSIANDDLNEPNHPRQEPVPRTDPTPRPYQSQCRGERPRNARVPFCPHCGEDCHNISVLRYHVKTMHSEPSGCLCCCFCTAVFNLHSSAEYKQHTLDTHGVKYT